jgi:AcrR family transcriptional regulator
MSSVNQNMSDPGQASADRIPAAERREQILAAASHVFGQRGYAGATTDQVAQAAGISQPYVVRMFGSKENLFVEVLNRARVRLLDAFRAVLADAAAASLPREELVASLGRAYADLIEDRGIVLSLMQGFVIGHEPVIGATARAGFVEIYRLLRDEGGFTAEEAMSFLAHGMLFNTLVALRLTDHYGEDASADELLACTFGTKLETVLKATGAAE